MKPVNSIKSKITFGIIIGLIFLYLGCSQLENPTEFQTDQSSLLIKKDGLTKNEKKLRKFAKAMAKSLEHQGVRRLLKDEIGKKFDGDFEVLWKDIKNQK